MKKRSELFFRAVLVPIDYLMVVAGFAMAYIVRQEQSKPLAYLVSGRSFIRVILPVLVLWIVIFAFAGLYDLKATRSRMAEMSRVVMASAVGVMTLIIIDFFSKEPIFPSKAIPIYGFVFAVVFVGLARFILYGVQQMFYRIGLGTHNVLILGKGPSRIGFEKDLKEEFRLYWVAGNKAVKNDLSISWLNLQHNQHSLDDIFLLEDGLDKEVTLKCANFCRQNQIQLHIVPTMGQMYNVPMRMNRIKNIPVMELVSTPLEGWGRIVKRFVDILFACLVLIIAAPFLLIIGILIKIFDPGPVFYAHKRLTRSGKAIMIYKLRTMKQEYCTGGKYSGKDDIEVIKGFNDPALIEEFKRDQKLKNDPRVSPLGGFLRRSSIDEIPQLINIIKGDLSFVGPRPIVASELERYGDESGLFLHIKPGLTGLWQVSGRNDVNYDSRVKLDVYYIENWSIGLDIAILIRTIPVLFHRNGY